MTDGIPDLIADGPQKRVRLLVLPSGEVPARDFLEGLLARKKTAAKAMAVLRTAGRLGTGEPLPRGIYRKFDDTFNEIACTGCRMLTYTHEGEVLLVHGFLKKENKAPSKEVRAAYRILAKFRGSKT